MHLILNFRTTFVDTFKFSPTKEGINLELLKICHSYLKYVIQFNSEKIEL